SLCRKRSIWTANTSYQNICFVKANFPGLGSGHPPPMGPGPGSKMAMAGMAARIPEQTPVQVTGALAGQEDLLSPAALAFLARLHRAFEPQRQTRLAARRQRQARFDAGELPDFRTDTRALREADWTVAPLPEALLDRRVEITGPVEPKMVINALNSGANCYM